MFIYEHTPTVHMKVYQTQLKLRYFLVMLIIFLNMLFANISFTVNIYRSKVKVLRHALFMKKKSDINRGLLVPRRLYLIS